MTRWPNTALLLSVFVPLAGCEPQGGYDQASYEQLEAANRQLQADNAALHSQLTEQAQLNMYTVAADLLFPPGAFDITPRGQAALNDILARLRGLKNSKIVVYGYTDDERIGGASLKKQGITTNMDLSSKRADVVVNYLRDHGVNPNILSAKGRGDTHPVASNSTPEGRARNRRIEIVVEGPGT
jgi:chemotaxis protein MotB